jgi:hypothetical protein
LETEIVGRVQDPQAQAFDPIVVPVAAYSIEGKEVIERFQFRPVMPAGAVIRAFRSIQPNGVLATAPILDFLTKSLLNESERERFLEFLDRDDLMIEADLITAVYETVTEVWSARPTRLRSVSASGGSPARRTSRAAARSRASAASKNSH